MSYITDPSNINPDEHIKVEIPDDTILDDIPKYMPVELLL